jgi:hypothetical protein
MLVNKTKQNILLDRNIAIMNNLDQQVKQYLIDCIDTEGTAAEKIEFARDRFNSEYGKLIHYYGNEQLTIQNWLQGLCSAVPIAFMNVEILELAKQWGSLPEDATEKQEDKILANYWNFMAAKLLQLFNGYRVPKEQAA